MEPPQGVLASFWSFIRFLPFFVGLLILGTFKGTNNDRLTHAILSGLILCPLVCLLVTVGNTAITLGLWPVHIVWTYYSTLRAKILGPWLKLLLCISVLPVVLLPWPLVAIIGSLIGGAAYGFLSPIFATFDAVGEGRANSFIHCLYDGTWSTVEGSFTVVRDFYDVFRFSYFSIMEDLRIKEPKHAKYEIRLQYLPGVILAGVLGIFVDLPMISFIALYKSPYMLFKGWSRLLHDLIGREGPFLETICVPFAGLAILLWPLAVVGSVLGSTVSSIFLGAYAGVIVYQESSFIMGLRYIVASLSIYDEYSNDVLDMPEWSCFPRPYYRKKDKLLPVVSQAPSFSKPNSFRGGPTRTGSIRGAVVELKPLELLDSLFKDFKRLGEIMACEGLITIQDVEGAKSKKGSRVLSVGLPAYCILQTLLRSTKANSAGILLSDDTEITSTNRPRDTVFEWFLNPLLIIKEQIKALNLSEEEESYLCKLVLLSGDPERVKDSNIGSPPESEVKRAELDALARRLQGITRSISRYPTFRRRFENLVKVIAENLAEKNQQCKSSDPHPITRSKSAFARLISLKSFKGKGTSTSGSDHDSHDVMIKFNEGMNATQIPK